MVHQSDSLDKSVHFQWKIRRSKALVEVSERLSLGVNLHKESEWHIGRKKEWDDEEKIIGVDQAWNQIQSVSSEERKSSLAVFRSVLE